MTCTASPSWYMTWSSFVSRRASSRKSVALTRWSKVFPEIRSRKRIWTNARRFPGVRCWKSITRQGFPSQMMTCPLRTSLAFIVVRAPSVRVRRKPSNLAVLHPFSQGGWGSLDWEPHLYERTAYSTQPSRSPLCPGGSATSGVRRWSGGRRWGRSGGRGRRGGGAVGVGRLGRGGAVVSLLLVAVAGRCGGMMGAVGGLRMRRLLVCRLVARGLGRLLGHRAGGDPSREREGEGEHPHSVLLILVGADLHWVGAGRTSPPHDC